MNLQTKERKLALERCLSRDYPSTRLQRLALLLREIQWRLFFKRKYYKIESERQEAVAARLREKIRQHKEKAGDME